MNGLYLTTVTMDIRLLLRERLMIVLTVAFLLLAIASSLIGWSTSHTVHGAYAYSVPLMQPGVLVPPDPFAYTSHLSLLANLGIYLFLIGSLLAIVLGYIVGSRDRTSGTLSLVLSRISGKWSYVAQKIVTLGVALFILIGITFGTLVVISMLVPELSLDGGQIGRLLGFLAVSWAYLLLFSIIALACSLLQSTATRALMIPIIIWVLIGFMLPQILTRVEPVALLNPVLLADQAASLSHSTVSLLSVGQQYTTLGLGMLEYGNVIVTGAQVASLLLFTVATIIALVVSIRHWHFSEGGW